MGARRCIAGGVPGSMPPCPAPLAPWLDAAPSSAVPLGSRCSAMGVQGAPAMQKPS